MGVFVLPGMAHASCAAPGIELTNVLDTGVVEASETPISNTCNQNNAYRAMLRSSDSAWRASIWFYDSGHWRGYFGGYNLNEVEINHHDTNYTSSFHLCLDDGVTWKCGLDDDFTQSAGVTHFVYRTSTGF
jgi:hypothetical protein